MTEQVGPYVVERHLAQGGMGTLSVARAPDGTAVVLKRPIVGRATPQARALAQREAEITRGLDHPGVIRVLDVIDDGGVPVLVMEHLTGLTLQEIAKRARREERPLPLEPLLQAIGGIAAALAYLHDLTDERGVTRGLVHRDVSPDNVFVTERGDVKLLDFGVARADDLRDLTMAGGLRGKRGFFAPELIRGQDADAATDLFALGVSAYALISGVMPWGRKDPGPAYIAMIAAPAPPLSQHQPLVPAAVDDLVTRLIAVDRAARFASGHEVVRLIDALLARVPSELRSPARLIDAVDQEPSETTTVRAHNHPTGEPASADERDDSSDDSVVGTRPAQRWDQHGANADIDEASSTAMARPVASPSSAAPRALPVWGRADSQTAPAVAVAVASPTVTLLAPRASPLAVSATPPAPRTIAPTDLRRARAASASSSSVASSGPNPTTPTVSRARRAPRRAAGIIIGAALGLSVVGGVTVRLAAGGDDARLATQGAAASSSPPATPPSPPPVERPAPVAAPTPSAPAMTEPEPEPTSPPAERPAPPDPPAPTTPMTSRQKVTRVSVRGPASVQWLLGARALRTGPGTVEVPAGTPTLRARDARRLVTSAVPVVDGVADYDGLPRRELLLRARPWAVVTLGADRLGQTPLAPVSVVAGRYTVRFEQESRIVERTIDVRLVDEVVKVNVDMDAAEP